MEHLDLLLHSYIDLFRASLAYFILVFLLPSFMLKPIAKDRNLYERIMIYIIVGNFYLMMVTFVLAYLGIFNRVILIISVILFAVIIRVMLTKKTDRIVLIGFIRSIQDVFSGKQGLNLYVQEIISNMKIKTNKLYKTLFANKKIEWIIFICICAFNVYMLNYTNYTTVSYIFPDVEVHLYWIQSLMGGDIFPRGAYPHLMHTVFATMITFFNFDPIIFIKQISIFISILTFTMLYFGLRFAVKSKYTALLAFFIYCVPKVFVDGVSHRFQAALPQEYGMLLLIPMGIFLYNYLNNKKLKDLILFGFSLSLTISAHFYTGIIAVLFCVSFGIVYFKSILKSKLLLRLIICGILSLVIAIAPLAVGVAIGKGIEPSMDWALGVITNSAESASEASTANAGSSLDFKVFAAKAMESISTFFFREKAMSNIYIYILTGGTIFLIILSFIKKFKKRYIKIFPYILLICMLTFLSVSRYLNIPEIILSSRIFYYLAYYLPFLIALPLEVVYNLGKSGSYKKICSYLTLLLIPTILAYMIFTNSFRNHYSIIYFQTKGAMLTDIYLIDNYEDYTWTVVSPINDMSVIMNNGYHYELSDFVYNQENWTEETEITIPTKYIFIYIEKIPRVTNGMVEYANYEELKERINSHITISYDYALNELETTEPPEDVYTTYRRILMSKAYYWAKEYEKYFPEEMMVFYEDDEIIIYKLTQNEYALNNLAINYGLNSISKE